ncbi:hypothetical protein AAVH_31463, partial [Aphelenchoides avenae]
TEYDVDKLLKQVRHINALFRMKFRQSTMMHLTERERELISKYMRDAIERKVKDEL